MSSKRPRGVSTARTDTAPEPEIRPDRFVGGRWSLAAVGAFLLVVAGVINLHLLGLAELVRLEQGRVVVGGAGESWALALPLPRVGASLVVVSLLLIALAAIGVWVLARRYADLDRLRLFLRGRSRFGLAVGVAILGFGFLPIGMLRSLAATYLFYLAAVPGMILLLYAVWPGLHGLVVKATPRFERVVFGSSALLFAGTLFGLTFLMAAGLSFLLFDFTPRIPTGIAHWFHARILASGSLYAEAPPLPEFFSLLTVVSDSGRWFAIFPLGHTALVAGALKLGAPWIVNPLCGAVTVVLFYFLGKELFGERTGRLTAAFGMLSPFFMFMSSEFYNNASSLLFCTAFLLFFVRGAKSARLQDGLLAGLFLGLALHTRPVTAVAVALPCIGYSLWLLRGSFRRYLVPLVAICIVTLVFAGLLLVSNYGITGDPLTTGYSHAAPVEGDRALAVSSVVPNTVVRVRLLNRYLFQWAIPSLLPIGLLFVAGGGTRWDYLLLSLLPSGLLVYAGWYHLGLELGPRYLYFATGALVILAVRGFQSVPGLVREAFGADSSLATRTGAATLVVACFLSAALLNWIPMATLYGSDQWWALDRSVVEKVRSAGLGQAIVFVPDGTFRSVFLDNSIPVARGDVIYARDLGERNPELMFRFPHRRGYRLDAGRLVEITSASER